jgi:AraC family transcriptional regulator
MMATAMYASNSSIDRLTFQDSVDRAPIGVKPVHANAEVESWPSLGGVVVHPTVKINPGKSVKRLGTGWRRWFSESIHIPSGSKIEFRFRGRRHLLALYNEGTRRDGETSIDGLYSSKLRSFMHKLTFVPAGCAYRESHETGASTRITFLYLDPAVFPELEDGESRILPRIYFEDCLVWETASKLKGAIEGGQTQRISYLEALSNVLAHELSRVDQAVIRQPAVSRGGLAGWQKRALVDYIEEHLGEPSRLLKLAEVSQLSLHHFCRAFKQSFGIPPHQYQVRRRMEVAKLLLADRITSVTDIALSLGYAQVSSFSNAFRKTTGWTPTAYRREFK